MVLRFATGAPEISDHAGPLRVGWGISRLGSFILVGFKEPSAPEVNLVSR